MSEDSKQISLDKVGEDNQENSETSYRHIRQLGIDPPGEWEEIRIGKIGELDTSSVDKKSDAEEKSVDLVNYMDVYERYIINSEIDYMGVTAPDSHIERSQVVPGDILFTPSSEEPGDIGNSAVVTEEMERTVHSYHTVRLRPTSANIELDIGFSGWLANAPYVAKQFARRATGSTRYTLTLGDFAETRVLVPPVSEQRKIASVLYTVDQTIQKTEEIIEQMAKAKTAMVEELTMRGVGHADFKKADITPKYLDIEFPVSWEKVTYEEVTKNITYGFTNPMPEADSGPWMVTAKDIEDGRINYNTSRKTTEQAFSEKLTSKSRPEPGTVLVTKDGTLGRVAVVDKEGICINQSVASLNPIEEKVIPQFLALTIKSPLAKKLIEAYNPQTTIGHIKISELAEWEFGLPPLEEQREIVSIVNSARERYFAEQEYKSQLERLKQGLMQDLLSGEVRTHDTDIEIVDEVLQHG